MQSILATGLSGLVGTRIAQLLTSYSFTDLSFSTGVDITCVDQLENAFAKSDAPVVLHLAALADVEKCETEKELAYKINVLGTKNVAEACKKYNKKLIHISTDFVFPGDNQEYFEDSERRGVNYYAETKILAENEVMNALPKEKLIIIRITFPYKLFVENEPKKSFVQRMYELLKEGKELTVISDSFSRPTYIDDIAASIDRLIKQNLHGIYHCVGESYLSGVQEAEEICEVFSLNKKLIKPVKMDDYFQGRAKRPRHLNTNNGKIKKETGIEMRTFKQGLEDVLRLMS